MPFEKGKSGNPATQFRPGNPGGGRPRRDHVSRHLIELLGQPESNPAGRKIAALLLRLALKGNMQAIREVLDRAEGKAATLIGGLPDEPLGVAVPETIEECNARLREIAEGVRERERRAGYEWVRRPIKKRPKAKNNGEIA